MYTTYKIPYINVMYTFTYMIHVTTIYVNVDVRLYIAINVGDAM